MARLLVLVCIAACDAQRVITSESSGYALAVRVQLPVSLRAVGEALNWPSGIIPGARVVAERSRVDSTEPLVADTVTSDAQGVAQFRQLTRASYALRVERRFTNDERTRAAAALADVAALVSSATVTLADSASASFDVVLRPVGGSSLIFTEISPAWAAGGNGDQYYYGGYFRITNNSDTVVTLAGKIWFDAYGGYIRNSTVPSGCNYFLPLERDPAGIWTRWVYVFPPDAKPLQPGASVALATDALDHRSFGPSGFHDLSRAEFEFVYGADADNPLSLNMISVAPQEYAANHGWRFRGGRQVWGLSAPLNVDTLPRSPFLPFSASRDVFIRVPTAALLDVVRYNWDVAQFDPSTVDCPSPILSDIDLADAVYLSVQDTLTLRRRVSRVLPNGRVIYQRSRNSAADWFAGPGSQ